MSRSARRSGNVSSAETDFRSFAQHDRDRILYSDYFRRLGRVTQVACAADSGVFHDRLLHSLKVAQVGRRMAERFLKLNPDWAEILDPDVVEAAALAHDLGHPPFGHVAEAELNRIALNWGLADGFEGNAQTFRIVTRLATHSGRQFGLDLSRATLNATLKYPWIRELDPNSSVYKKRNRKFSVYNSDLDAWSFARPDGSDTLTLEAQVMDYADSISYSVHDLEDFYRAGLVPIERLLSNDVLFQAFVTRWVTEEPSSDAAKFFLSPENAQSVKDLLASMIGLAEERGSREDLELVEKYRSVAITAFIDGVERSNLHAISMDGALDYQCRFLHRLVKDYVILRPSLATQQYGQVVAIRSVADFFHDALQKGRMDRISVRFRHLALMCESTEEKSRCAIDIVASLAEDEVLRLYARIQGIQVGSLLDGMA